MDELACHGQADPAVAAQDVVARKLVDCLDHSFGLPSSARRLNHKVLGHDADRAEDEPDPHDRKDHRPDAAGIGERLDFSETDGGEGDDRHVERIEQSPARLDDDVARRTDDDAADDDGQPDPDVGARDHGRGCRWGRREPSPRRCPGHRTWRLAGCRPRVVAHAPRF